MKANSAIFLFLFLVFINHQLHSQQIPDSLLVPENFEKNCLLQPTGKLIDSLPEMTILSDTAQLYKDVKKTIESTFISDITDIYLLAQNYKRNTKGNFTYEPLYLAVTKNQGGYAKKGFVINTGNEIIRKEEAPYIDIHENSASNDVNKLMSISQLFPHETGHIIFRMISTSESEKSNANSLTMHYFSLITDYSTAFNEGFAEHIENAVRLYERNDTLRDQILEDIENKKGKYENFKSGFKRDFTLALRVGYYKTSMLFWYQQYEDLIRHEQSLNMRSKYKNRTLKSGKAEKRILYRNSGVEKDSLQIKNLVQSHMTEGVVSSFFTNLLNSNLKEIYLPDSFYIPFLYDTTENITGIESYISPVQNHFIKCIYILSNYIDIDYSERSQFGEFLEMYKKQFPSESNGIDSIYEKVTGHHITEEIPEPLWLISKEYKHILLVLDPYGSIRMPAYTFDLNAAEIEDLMTLNISEENASAIINFRNTTGFFSKADQIKDIPGIDHETAEKINNSLLDQTYLDELNTPDLNVSALILGPVKNLLFKTLIYTLLILTIIYIAFLRREKQRIIQYLYHFLKYYIQTLFILLFGLFIIVADIHFLFPILIYLILTVGISFLLFKKKKVRLYRSVTFHIILSLLLIYSMF